MLIPHASTAVIEPELQGMAQGHISGIFQIAEERRTGMYKGRRVLATFYDQ